MAIEGQAFCRAGPTARRRAGLLQGWADIRVVANALDVRAAADLALALPCRDALRQLVVVTISPAATVATACGRNAGRGRRA